MDACRQALEQFVEARRNFYDARNRLLSEITCEEIQSYLKEIDIGES
jgi:hypothetical protein